MKKSGLLSLAVFSLIFLFSACEDPVSEIVDNDGCPTGDLRPLNLLMGNPSNATADENNPDNYLIEMDEYTISYNNSKGIPNWVSWHLSTDWFTGDGNRQDDFRPNPFLPSSFYAVDDDAYSGSGFDRGHCCPSADRLCSDATNSRTFFMTNMIPQAPGNNQGPWACWEKYLRYLAGQDKELYVIMGQYGQGGTGFFGYRETVDEGNVWVPSNVWKVAIAIPRGEGNDLDFIDSNSEIIAINILNNDAVGDLDWDDSSFLTTVDAIEAATGYDLFSNVQTSVQNNLESQVHSIDANFDCGF